MKILNLFAGIGGNRTLWGNRHEITAIEHDQRIAMIYLKRFPKDIVIVGDAYEYFLRHFDEFDMIWASPPCTSHTNLVHCLVGNKRNYKNFHIQLPDLRLYSIIIFLKEFFRGTWIVENVKPYYKALIPPTSKVGRHSIWSNIPIPKKKKEKATHLSFSNFDKDREKILSEKQIPLEIYEMLIPIERMKRKQIINNTLLPIEGKYILDSIINKKQKSLEVFI